MSQIPLSVVLPVFNNAEFIGEAIDSILNQTFREFELILIDDGSTDGTKDIVESYREKDDRISVVLNSENQGVAACRNEGNAMAKGEYVAVMDGDDVSLPNRFDQQLKFMREQQLELCGSWVRTIPTGIIVKYPESGLTIKHLICFAPCFNHPSVIYRRDFIERIRYRAELRSAVDLALWTDILRLLPSANIANVPEVLHEYRLHHGQMSSTDKAEQWNNAFAIIENYLTELVPDLPQDQIFKLIRYVYARQSCDISELDSLYPPLSRVQEKFSEVFGHSTVLEKQFERIRSKIGAEV